jgi:predicted nuclease of restriction endonuclease-like (RecB) superfamily
MSRKSDSDTFSFLVPNLSWSHYVELLKVTRPEARRFYAFEASKGSWNIRELRRQIDSFLYDRLLKAKDKQSVLQVESQGHEICTPEDAIKEPWSLSF